MERDFIFWNMIEQRAYISDNARLNEGNWDRFVEREKDKSVYIFGCSEAGSLTADLLKNQFNIIGFLDNAKEKQGGMFEGKPVYAPVEKIPELNSDSDVILIVMRRSADAVAAQLEELGFTNIYSMGVLLGGIDPYRALIDRIEEARMRPLDDIIMLESTNDVDGNSGALYRYLKSNGSKHRFIWVLKRENSKSLLEGSGDIGLCSRDNLEDYKEYIYYLNTAKWQIWDNLSIPKMRSDQINVFLQHAGLGYKKIDKFFKPLDYIDYWLCVNEFVKEMIQPSFHMPDSVKTIYGTYPRNDILLQGPWNELEKLTDRQYAKTIIWTPTLRKSKYFDRSDSDLEYPYGIPVVYNEKDMNDLNSFLSERNTLLIIKPHPAQKRDYLETDFTNIIFLDSDRKEKIDTYKLLTQMDAMISDYSSIVFDYMLLDRMIAWAIDDMDHFKLDFLMDDPTEYMPGEKIYSMEDLICFISHVCDGTDLYHDERRKICKRVNSQSDISGCENIAKVLGL